MRKGKIDYEGKFWVGQRVRVKRPEYIKPEDVNCDTGVIRLIQGAFLRTPEMTKIAYLVRLDAPYLKHKILKTIHELTVEGENLEPL